MNAKEVHLYINSLGQFRAGESDRQLSSPVSTLQASSLARRDNTNLTIFKDAEERMFCIDTNVPGCKSFLCSGHAEGDGVQRVKTKAVKHLSDIRW